MATHIVIAVATHIVIAVATHIVIAVATHIVIAVATHIVIAVATHIVIAAFKLSKPISRLRVMCGNPDAMLCGDSIHSLSLIQTSMNCQCQSSSPYTSQ